jgi:hypothetical protein
VYRSGAIKIALLKDDTTQVVNGQRLKHYRDFYFRALGSLVVLSFPSSLVFPQFYPSPCLKPSQVLERPVARRVNNCDRYLLTSRAT